MKWLIVLLNLAFIGASLQRTTNQPTFTIPKTNNDFEEFGCKVANEDSGLTISDCEKFIVLYKEIWNSLNTDTNAVCIKNCTIGLDQDTFDAFDALHDVVIVDSVILKAHPNVFDKVDKLNIQNSVFAFKPHFNSSRMEELLCVNCNLTEVPLLDNLPNLEFLNLTNNNILSIDENTFANLQQLQEVSLANNKLTSIPLNAFANNAVLDTITLDGNELSKIQLNISSLEILSLQSCHLTEFDGSLTQELIQLNLKDNDISTITIDSFSPLVNLEIIDLSFNSFKSLDAAVFSKNKNLEKIILDNNLLLTLPKFFLDAEDGTFMVEYFSCNNCGLRNINSEIFANMPQLSTLLLARNELEIIDKNSFSNLMDLLKLDLSENQIRMISKDAFSSNLDLQNINLLGNPLVSLDPTIFANHSILQTLDVRCTKLNKLWLNHDAELPSLFNLYASDNNITDITNKDFSITKNLKTIDLTNNPFDPLKDWCPLIVSLKKKDLTAVKYDEKLAWEDTFSYKLIDWESLFNKNGVDCSDFDLDDDEEPINPLFDMDEDEETEDESTTDDYSSEYNYEDDNTREMRQFEETLKAANILSLTAAFICTAVIVLIAAVTITLCILKRNNNYNRNLPHFKIKLWNDAQLGQKKHSGSVYRPLSEDLTGPKTPKFSRYEFMANPTVHTTNNS